MLYNSAYKVLLPLLFIIFKSGEEEQTEWMLAKYLHLAIFDTRKGDV